MNGFMMAAAMNPNISSAQLIELSERNTQATITAIETFGDCLAKLKTNEERMRYFNACFPILILML